MIYVFPYSRQVIDAIAQQLGSSLTGRNQRYVVRQEGDNFANYWAVETDIPITYDPSPIEFSTGADYLVWLNEAIAGYVPPEGFQFTSPPTDDFQPAPDPSEFLKHCFSGDDTALFDIFTKVFGLTFTDPAVNVWYGQMIHGSRASLFVLGEPPESTGWGLAVTQLAAAAGLTDEERAIVNQALPQYGLPPLL